MTPREILVRLRDHRDIVGDASLAGAHRRWDLDSAERVVTPKPGAHQLRTAIERTWVLRFSRHVDLAAAIADYETVASIDWAEPNTLYRTLQGAVVPDDPEYENLWNLPGIAMPRAWAIERGDPSVVVAVIDTGTTLGHPDLEGQLWQNQGEVPGNGRDDDANGFVDDVHGWDFVDAPTASGRGDFNEPDGDPTDETGHGTHVSGIVSARPDNGIDIAGVAWNCRLMAVRSGFAASGGGTFLQEDDSSAGIIYAVENGASVINMSWGDERGSRLLRDTLRYANAMGVVLVSASGNENHPSVLYPAAFPEVISVAASARDGGAARFTNATAEVDLAAPGVSILSLHTEGRVRTLSGTSMSAPHVAGVAALMLSKRPGLRVDEVKRLLVASGSALVDEGRAVGVPLLNAANALMASESLIAEIAYPGPRLGGDRSVEIVGSVGGPDYAGYRLSIGETSTPATWTPLVDARGRDDAGFNRLLYVWDTSALAEGTYTLRLETYASTGSFVRDQRLVEVDHTPPRVLRHELFHALSGGLGVPFLWVEFDDTALASLTVRDSGTGVVHDATEFATPQRHFILSLTDSVPDGAWEYTFVARNFAGMETTVEGVASGGREVANPGNRAVQPGNRLPSLDVAPRLVDFNGNGLPEIVGSSPGTEGFVFTQVFEARDGGQLRSVHQFPDFFTPLDVGDLDGDGLVEALGQVGDDLIVIEAPAVGQFPSELIWTGDRMKHGRIVDADGDGSAELLATTAGSNLVVIRAVGDNAFEEIASLRNATEGLNFFARSRVVDDIDGDGRREIFMGDADGSLVAFRWDGATLRQVWETQTVFSAIHDVASGVFLGRRSVVVLGEESFGVTPRGGAMSTVAVYIWDENSAGLEVHPTPRRAIRRLRQRDDRARLLTGRLATEGDDLIAVISGGQVYLLRMAASGELALDWAGRADPTLSPVFLDLDGDGRASLLYNERGFLNVLTPDGAPTQATRPFALDVTALSSRSVHLTWRWAGDSSQGVVYRAVGDDGEFAALADATGEPTYTDEAVHEGERYRYEVHVGEAASDAVGIFIGEQPRLVSAEALTTSRVRLAYSLPMNGSARQASVYRVIAAGGDPRAWTPTSVARQGREEEVILTFSPTSPPPGDYSVEIARPNDVRSADDMPVDASARSTTLHIPTEPPLPTDLSRLRVYPNPVYVRRNHSARVEFAGMPAGAIARVYSVDGGLVVEGVADEHRNAWSWDLLNDSLRPVAPGVYIYSVEWGGRRRAGKLAVVR
ncbi:S8 family serine peptidase [Candidatus Poribacteria bacterium]|nr:S8 family serine peptidase [Candidatus Poribacteria bacterium]MBT5534278.1 S8 family serine peptidase [Candidatus Poribacteria bacterium]MBT5713439.1 S8 family serine peptidase [Candidatus Poribacteria bacterium]MBT7809126.1 S8 family serine peptidase [Candidatus Poribacteria bacterium]